MVAKLQEASNIERRLAHINEDQRSLVSSLREFRQDLRRFNDSKEIQGRPSRVQAAAKEALAPCRPADRSLQQIMTDIICRQNVCESESDLISLMQEFRQELRRLNDAKWPQDFHRASVVDIPKVTQARRRSLVATVPRRRSYLPEVSALIAETKRRLEEAKHQIQIPLSIEEPRPDELPLPPLDRLRRLLQTRVPLLYAQVLEPTLADLRQEHSEALAGGHPMKARCILLRGCSSLIAAAVCQLGYSLLGRIAALWQARSPK